MISSWQDTLRVALSVALLYPFVILSVRIAGKRSTASMNNYDWIFTVAMGSIVASGILSKEVAVTDSMAATALLLGFQWITTKLGVKTGWASRAIRARPTLLYYRGEFQRGAMISERVSRDDMEKAARRQGCSDMGQVEAIVMEADASLSVMRKIDGPSGLVRQVRKGMDEGELNPES